MRLLLLAVVLGLAGCATQHKISASTPRSVVVEGSALNSEDLKKAFDMAQAECAKHGRNALYSRGSGTRLNAVTLFDCVN
jgi:uncharacterized protein YcfL